MTGVYRYIGNMAVMYPLILPEAYSCPRPKKRDRCVPPPLYMPILYVAVMFLGAVGTPWALAALQLSDLVVPPYYWIIHPEYLPHTVCIFRE